MNEDLRLRRRSLHDPRITTALAGGGLGLTRLLAYLPRGNTLDDRAWHKRHVFLQGVLLLHLPLLFGFGLFMGRSFLGTLGVLSVPAACLVLGRLIQQRRVASVLITAGLTYCSAVLVGFSNGSIEAHFHFFIMIGFIALYQDWVPFLWNVVFTVLSHGMGSVWQTNLIFNHPAGQTSPWVWSGIHGAAVLAACCGVVIFWETTEREQRKTLTLTRQLADAEITRRRFTSDLLVNLARRNQSLLYRQLGLINQLEEHEEDPDALSDLFQLDHLATRIRRNAESLLVLSGEEPPRTWGRPVALVDVVRAAIAETEDLDRVVFNVEERLAVFGNAVADLTHLVAELVENAVHFSPPEASVVIRTRPFLQTPGAHVLTVEDWGVGMRPEDLDAGNDLLATPREVDLSVSQRLGLHVVARLAKRHGIEVSLTPTPGCGVTAAVVLPPTLFADPEPGPDELVADDAEITAEVVPIALPATVAATPAPGALPDGDPAPGALAGGVLAGGVPAGAAGPPGTAGWSRAEHWIDLTDEPEPAGNGNGHGTARPAVPDGDGADWSGWWEPSPGDLDHGGPLSPLAARPPLSERANAPLSTPVPPAPSAAAPEPQWPSSGAPEPHPPTSGPPEGEASPTGTGGLAGIHNPRAHHPHPAPGGPHPARVAVGEPAEPIMLSRRVPQAHLAPELRRPGREASAAEADGSLPDAAEARAALSRYQASRQAARAVVDQGGAAPGGRGDDAGPDGPPPSNGGWS
jgi:signal transduction histidine kinase